MAKTISELTPDEFGDLIKRAILSALKDHHQDVDERAKMADQVRQRLLNG